MYRLLLSLSMLPLFTGGCASHVVRVEHAPPAQVQLKLANVSRIWVAGFVSARAPESRPEFDLNAETVRLLRMQLRTWSSAQVLEAEPLAVNTDQLRDVAYWRRAGEERGRPLIVTGSVKLHLAPPKIEQRGKRTFYFPM